MSGQMRYGKERIKMKKNKYIDNIIEKIISILNFNFNFVVLFFLGIFSLMFESRSGIQWHEENKELIYSLISGIGISGIICWFFSFKIIYRKNYNFNLPYFLWLTCHLFGIFTFLYFMFILGVRQNGTLSGFALGVFFSLILYSPFSILYNILYSNLK